MIFSELDTDDALPDADRFGPECATCGGILRSPYCTKCYWLLASYRTVLLGRDKDGRAAINR